MEHVHPSPGASIEVSPSFAPLIIHRLNQAFDSVSHLDLQEAVEHVHPSAGASMEVFASNRAVERELAAALDPERIIAAVAVDVFCSCAQLRDRAAPPPVNAWRALLEVDQVRD